jgi:tetratricopeptide (TPR) repeat protein
MFMEVRTKNKKTLALLMLLLFSAAGVRSQIEKTLAAYAKSLDKEKKLDYFGAIRNMLELNDSTSYEANLRMGWLYYKAGQEKRSLHCYEKAIKANPNAIEAKIGFGYPSYLLEDMTDLIEQDKKILEIDPNNKVTNGNLALIYFYNKEYTKALPYFQKVVQMYPFDYDNNLSLAWTCFYLGKKAEAEKYFNVVLLYSPTDPSAKEGLETLGKTAVSDANLLDAFAKSYELSAASNNKGAIAAMKEKYDKSSYFSNLRLGWLTYVDGQHNEAVNYYKIAMELNPASLEAKLGCAFPIEAMGNKNELKTLYESILTSDPKNTAISYKLGNIFYERKDYASALTCYGKVVELYPFSYDGLLMYAWANYQTGKYDESRNLFYKVLCLSPGDRSATQGLSMKPVDEQKKPEPRELIKPK